MLSTGCRKTASLKNKIKGRCKTASGRSYWVPKTEKPEGGLRSLRVFPSFKSSNTKPWARVSEFRALLQGFIAKKRLETMFHDPKFYHAPASPVEKSAFQLGWSLNPHACKLLLMLQHFRNVDQKVIPVAYLKRCGFTRRGWELATKGTRERVGNKLVSDACQKDGLQFHGLISEILICEPGQKPQTFWVLGDLTQEAREQASDAYWEAVDAKKTQKTDKVDAETGEPDEALQAPSMLVDEAETEIEAAYNQGRADQRPRSEASGAASLMARINQQIWDDPFGHIKGVAQEFIWPRDAVAASVLYEACDGLKNEALAEIEARRVSEASLGF